MKPYKNALLSTLCVIALTACATDGKTITPPAVTAPANWSGQSSTPASPVATDWWKNFDSSELDALVATALKQNNDLNAALHRIAQARASLKIAGAATKPTLDASGNLGANRSDPARGSVNTDASGSAGLNVGYELDLFGKNRAAIDSAQAGLTGTVYDADALALVTMTDTANAFFNLVSLRERAAIARDNLKNMQDVGTIVAARLDAGTATAIDKDQQDAAIRQAQATLESLNAQQTAAQTALALLLGQNTEQTTVTTQTLAGLIIPSVDAGLPSQLLERRPDIKAAESALQGADADIRAARAAFYPGVNLGAGFDITKSPLADPTATAMSLAASLAAPIFSGGKLEGGVEKATARQAELAETYRKTVLTAFKDVDDALAGLHAQQARRTLLAEAALKAQNVYDLNRQKYEAGSIDLQTLLTAQNTWLSARDTLAQSRAAAMTAAATLYKALGGGWTAE